MWKFAEHSAGLKQNNFFIVRIHFSKTITKYITLNTINVLYSKLLENPFKGSVLTKLHNCRSEPKKKNKKKTKLQYIHKVQDFSLNIVKSSC